MRQIAKQISLDYQSKGLVAGEGWELARAGVGVGGGRRLNTPPLTLPPRTAQATRGQPALAGPPDCVVILTMFPIVLSPASRSFIY